MKYRLILIISLIGLILITGCSTSQSDSSTISKTSPVTPYPTTQITQKVSPTIPVVSFQTTSTSKITAIPTTANKPVVRTTVEATTIPSPSVVASSQSSEPCSCSSDNYNCRNFKSRAEAQSCYEYCKSQDRGDIHNLDGDNNGQACESIR